MSEKPICTCIKEGSFRCKYPHSCRYCYQYHPGVSCYWHAQGKTSADKKPGGRTFLLSDGTKGCDECCNGDRCDDPSHFNRENCPFCLGINQPAVLEQGDAGQVAVGDECVERMQD